MVGSTEELKTEAAAQRAVDALRLTINEQTPRQQLQAICFATLVQHYREHELPDLFCRDQSEKRASIGNFFELEGRKSFATQDTYEGYLKKWILPRWRP